MKMLQQLLINILYNFLKIHDNLLSSFSKIAYRIDARTLFLKKHDKLSRNQKKEIKKYWKKYTKNIDIAFQKYYINRNGGFDVRYIPDDLYSSKIDKYLNNRIIDIGFSDKNYFDIYFNGFKMPKTYVHLINGFFLDANYKLIDKNKAAEILVKKKQFVSKPSMTSYGGNNVKIWRNVSYDEIDALVKNPPNNNMIFQEIIEQSETTACFHSSSVNTIRIITLIVNNKAVVLHSILRMGVDDLEVDNANAGGVFCGINPDGSLKEYAYNLYGEKYDKHPNGKSFKESRIDCMEKIYDIVITLAQRFPHFRLINWDIAIDLNNEPIIIEANFNMGDVDVIQPIWGPLFGEYTDTILQEVYLKDNKELFDKYEYYRQFI